MMVYDEVMQNVFDWDLLDLRQVLMGGSRKLYRAHAALVNTAATAVTGRFVQPSYGDLIQLAAGIVVLVAYASRVVQQ